MNQPAELWPASRLAFFFCLAVALTAPRAGDAVPASKSAQGEAPPASSAPAVSAAAPAEPAPRAPLSIPPRAQRLKTHKPGPLKRLTYSAREGFALRMVSNQDVTAEIRNGAGRTLAFTSKTLDAGHWTLRPRNLAPGLYTVLLRTGPNLRALRLKIEDSERGEGRPEWVVEKSADSTAAPAPQSRGAFLTE